MCNMDRNFNSEVPLVAFIRHCMDEELNTLCVSEYNKHEYSTYATFMVTSKNFLLFPKYS